MVVHDIRDLLRDVGKRILVDFSGAIFPHQVGDTA